MKAVKANLLAGIRSRMVDMNFVTPECIFRDGRALFALCVLLHLNSVHCFRMKNITLSADENLIEQARLIAKAQHRTLNAAFREWLEQFTGQSRSAQEFDSLMKRLKHVKAGRRFTREEMNEP